MNFLRVFATDLRQVLSWRLVFAIIITLIIYGFAGLGFIGENTDVWYIVGMAVWGSTAFFTLFTIPSFVFSSAIAMDWQDKATRYWIIRIGSDRYTVSKLLACAIAGFLAHFIAALLLIVILSAKFPLYIQGSSTEVYERTLMQNGRPLIGMLLFIADRSMQAVIAAEIGMVISVFFTHPYVAVAAPLGIILTMSRLIYKYKLPSVIDMLNWNTISAETAGATVLYKFLLTFFYTILFSCIAVYGMRRKIAHE